MPPHPISRKLVLRPLLSQDIGFTHLPGKAGREGVSLAAPDKGRACLEARAQRRSRPHEARHPCNWKAPLSASTQSGPIGIPSSRTGAELKGRDGCLEETAWECRSSTSLCLTRNKWDATLSAGPCPCLPWQLWEPHAPLLRPRLPQDSGGRTAEVAGGGGGAETFTNDSWKARVEAPTHLSGQHPTPPR